MRELKYWPETIGCVILAAVIAAGIWIAPALAGEMTDYSVITTERVKIVASGISAAKDPPRSLRVFDATDLTDPLEAVESFELGAIDVMIIGVPMPGFASACDDASDCSDAIEDACDVLGQSVSTVNFSATDRWCEGTCANGSGVSVVCSKQNRIIVDDGAPF